ncbi:hypothetical protein QZH41_001367 [Actinostola sp. cb2023]|nr:hypothetical protein QZH41_001367 [Actinostola sp. cb2023]
MSCCSNCASVSKYICLTCQRPVCNKSSDCSVWADEETPGWKAGIAVAWCLPCFNKRNAAENLIGDEEFKEEEPVNRSEQQVNQTEGSCQVETASSSSKAKKKARQRATNDGQSRKCLPLSEKVQVIHASQDEKQSIRQLAKRFACGKTQIAKIIADKEKIIDEWMSNGSSKIKRNNFEKYEEINRILWDWYVKARASNIPVDGPLLKEEAMLIAKQLGVTTFKGTEGWFSKWKQRHNIAQFNIAGEEGDVSEDTVESWSERVKELTKGYAAADIWNEDETGTFWKALPIKSLSEKGKRCRGGKNAKQRITAAFFVSADGGKDSVVLIGNSKKPRCFANLVDISRPCGAHYFSNAKAWMKTEIMENVISKLNGKMKRENRNIILFLDNAPCHPPSLKGKFSNIQIEFLPKNTTSRTQPLDAGIIKTWKTYYRRKLLRYVVGQMDGEKTASEIVKSVNLLMAVRWVVSAWKEVPAAVISKCFKKVGMYPDENLSAEEDDDSFEGEELMDIPELLSHISPGLDMSAFDDEADAFERPIDTTHPNWREVVRQEIIAASTNEEQVYEISNDDEEYDQPLQLPEVTSAEQAMELVGRLAAFSDWQGNEPLAQAITKVSDVLVDMRLKSLKARRQSIITDYFS